MSTTMLLSHPFGLILLLPLAAVLLKWRFTNHWLSILRIVIFLLLIAALCRPVIKLPTQAGVVMVVADRSRSMPVQSASDQSEVIDLISQRRPSDNLLGVVAFGRQAVAEHPPAKSTFAGFVNALDDDQSGLAEALDMALALIPSESSGRILVLSDGQYTGVAPNDAAVRAAARNIAIDYRLFHRPCTDDTAIIQIAAPETVTAGAAFFIKAQISAPSDQMLEYVLLRGNTPIAAGKKEVHAGETTLWFRDHATAPGVVSYRLRIAGAVNDPIPENNHARLLVHVEGARPLLLVTESEHSGLADILAKGGLDIHTTKASESELSLTGLSSFAAIIIENVSADLIGQQGMANIAAWVQNTGAGLMLTGGKHAFGPGGYFRSPLAPVIPVSMEIKKEHRKLAVAIVAALDRSGSMAARVSDGRTKMDLANLGAVQVPDLLAPFDEFGVIAVDSAVHPIINLNKINKIGDYEDKILRIESGGGGIFVYSALMAAAEMLHKAEARTRHIVLFADAADAEQPGKYQELLAQCQRANISVSVIGLGTPEDRDADFLRDIALRGGGRLYFTDHPTEIPRLFIQDTFTVMRSAFIEESVSSEFTPAWRSIASERLKTFPNIGGYNLCYLKPDANQALVTTDENRAPLAAFWQSGAGRTLAYMGEADGEFTGQLAHDSQAGGFFTSLARWISGAPDQLPDDMMITQHHSQGVLKITLELDPERQEKHLSLSPRAVILRSRSGEKPRTANYPLQWVSPDRLEAEIPLTSRETVLSVVNLSGGKTVRLAPSCLPYSPEFKPVQTDFGLKTMQTLAQMTGGHARADLAGIWDDLPVKRRYIEIAHWLIISALVLFLLEILQRRTGILTYRRRLKIKTVAKKEKRGKYRPFFKKRVKNVPSDEAAVSANDEDNKKDGDMADAITAFQQAAHLANKRMKRK